MASEVFRNKSFVAITGASRGLGKVIAIKFAERLPPASVIVLMARGVDALEKTKTEINATSPDTKVIVQYFDQGTMDQKLYDGIFKNIMSEKNLTPEEFKQSIIVHNAGVMCDVKKMSTQLTEVAEVRQQFDVNVTGMVALNSAFFQIFSDSSKSRLIVNISSTIFSEPSPSMHIYSATKAARDIFFRVLVQEDPTIRVLTYHPGAVETSMLDYIREESTSEILTKKLKDMTAAGNVQTPNASVEKLIRFLEENAFGIGLVDISG